MIIRFTLRPEHLPRRANDRLEGRLSGEARRFSRREIEHRERMLEHLLRTRPESNSPFPAR